MKEKQIVFSDHIGRIVAGIEVSSTETHIVVKNPVIIHVEPQPNTGQFRVHTFPYIFLEFVSKEARDNNNWTFDKSNIAISDVELDEKLSMAVANINTPPSNIVQPNQNEAKIVSLFDND